MSGQDKLYDRQDYDHTSATRPTPGQDFAGAQPQFAFGGPHNEQPREPYALLNEQPAQYSYGSGSVNFQDSYGTYMYARSRHPEITSWGPQTGLPGIKLYVHLQHSQDLTTLPRYFSIIFREKAVHASLMSMGQTGHYFHYALSVDVPSVNETPLESVPLCLNMQDETGNSLVFYEFGSFVYTSHLRNPATGTSQDHSRKRKTAADSNLTAPQPAKRTSAQQLHEMAKEHSAMYSLATTQEESSPPATQYRNVSHGLVTSMPDDRIQASSPTMPPPVDYNRAQTSGTLSRTQSSGPEQYSSASTPVRTPLLSQPFPAVTVVARTKTKITSPSDTRLPQLIRTSTLQPSPDSPSAGLSQPFNPYSMYPHKAVLKIDGDLDIMANDWSDMELDNRRRLVQFERSQSGSTITTTFKPVTLEERAPNSICISCILWEERGQCFVTSVDTIYLLESLVAVRFTVEEKNRIRRNLEGFRPLTVSKSKTKEDSEEFFKVIMGFPSPKPRNIEKDVKVFPWKILAHALKKIISKYSASYSSTAGALLPHPTSVASSAKLSEGGAEPVPTTSSQSIPSPAKSLTAPPKHSIRLSPSIQASAESKVSGGSFEQRITTPSPGSSQAGYRHYGPIVDPRYMAVPSTPSTWEFGSYIDPSTTTLVTNNSVPRYGPVGRYEHRPRQSPSHQQPSSFPHQLYDPYDHPSHPP